MGAAASPSVNATLLHRLHRRATGALASSSWDTSGQTRTRRHHNHRPDPEAPKPTCRDQRRHDRPRRDNSSRITWSTKISGLRPGCLARTPGTFCFVGGPNWVSTDLLNSVFEGSFSLDARTLFLFSDRQFFMNGETVKSTEQGRDALRRTADARGLPPWRAYPRECRKSSTEVVLRHCLSIRRDGLIGGVLESARKLTESRRVAASATMSLFKHFLRVKHTQ